MFDSLFGGNSSSNDVVDLSSEGKSRTVERDKQERTLRVEYSNDPEIQAWRVLGPTGGFGEFQTKKAAMGKARSLLDNDNYSRNMIYTGIKVYKKNGALQKTIGDA